MEAINLGDEVRDKVTGFKGIAVARTSWLYGCDRITIQPPLDKDGKVQEAATFDVLSVEVITPGAKAADKRPAKTGGPQNDRAALRR